MLISENLDFRIKYVIRKYRKAMEKNATPIHDQNSQQTRNRNKLS